MDELVFKGASQARHVTVNDIPSIAMYRARIYLRGAKWSVDRYVSWRVEMMTGIPAGVRCIDAHNHVYGNAEGKLNTLNMWQLLESCNALNIEMVWISAPLTNESPSPAEVTAANDLVIEAMRLDARFTGFCFVNPGYADAAVREIDRCVQEHGMRGIKLYHQYLVCDPAQSAVMSHAAKLRVPVLMHAGKVCDDQTRAGQPRLSNSSHFRKAAAMFPDTVFIQGHIGGGGDWEWNIRELETIERVYIDISGSVIDSGMIRRTVDAVGAERVLFATDGSMEEGVGKLLDAGLSARELHLICHENAERLLDMRTLENA